MTGTGTERGPRRPRCWDRLGEVGGPGVPRPSRNCDPPSASCLNTWVSQHLHPSPAPLRLSDSALGKAGSSGPGASLPMRTPFRGRGVRVVACTNAAALAVFCFNQVGFCISVTVCLYLPLSLYLRRPSHPSRFLHLALPPPAPSPPVAASPSGPLTVPRSLLRRDQTRGSPSPPRFLLRLLHLGPPSSPPPRLGGSLPPSPLTGGGRCCDARGRGQEEGA